MRRLMLALVPGAGSLRDSIDAALERVYSPAERAALIDAAPIAAKPWARNLARKQLERAARVLPRSISATDERLTLIELLAELDARRRGEWQD